MDRLWPQYGRRFLFFRGMSGDKRSRREGSSRPLRCEFLEPRRLLSGVTLITHGFNGSVDDWVTAMADAIAARPDPTIDMPRYRVEVTDPGHDGGPLSVVNTSRSGPAPLDCADPEIVVLLNWTDVAGSLSLGGGYHRSTVDVAAAVAQAIVSPNFLTNLATPLAELPFHLIGHSRGASLVGELAKDLGQYGVWVDQVTTLDPHPVDGVREPWLVNYDFLDASMTGWENVTYWDNYWRTEGSTSLDFTGESVSNVYNLQLDETVLSSGGYSYEHSDTHLWYHGTIDTSSTASDGEYSVPAGWYGGIHPARDATGFYYSQMVDGTRAGAGLSAQLGGAANRTDINWSAAAWPNILEFQVNAADPEFAVGESIPVTYYSQDADSSATISFSLDPDLNPYNQNATASGQAAVGRTSTGAPASGGASLPTGGMAPGTYYVAAKISDAAGHTRYAYAPELVTVMPAVEGPPTVEISLPSDGLFGVQGQLRTLAFTASQPGGPFTYRIDWGDGTTLQTVVGGASVQAAHTFAAAGAYTITATATDSAGATGPTASRLLEILVVEQQGANVLIGGTAQPDQMTLTRGAAARAVSVQVNQVSYGSFTVGTSGTVQFLGQGGGDAVVANGTSASDQFQFDASAGRLAIGDVPCEFGLDSVTQIALNGLGGTDQVSLTLSDANDAVDLSLASGTIVGGLGYTVTLASLEYVTIDGKGGADTAVLRDTAGNDIFSAQTNLVEHKASGYGQVLKNFPTITAYGGTGTDTANLYGSSGDDTFVAQYGLATMTSSLGYRYQASGFTYQYGYGVSGGTDTATLTGSDGVDAFLFNPSQAWISDGRQTAWAKYFATVTADGRGGKDTARLSDSSGNDVLTASAAQVQLKAPTFTVLATGFESVTVNASNGYDTAQFTDAAGNNAFTATPTKAMLTGSGYSLTASKFDYVNVNKVYGTIDTAYLFDSKGNDTFLSTPSYAIMSGSGYAVRVKGFNSAYAYSTSGGPDVAKLYGSTGADTLEATNQYVRLYGSKYATRAKSFKQVYVYGCGNADQGTLTDAVLTPGELDVSSLPPSYTQALWMRNFKKFTLKDSAAGTQETITAVDTVYTAYW